MILEEIARGASLAVVLENIVRLVERETSTSCALLVLEGVGGCVCLGAAPSLPPEYLESIDGAPIGPEAGACGAAACRGERLIVEDIAADPLSSSRPVALALARVGLRGCCATPIRAASAGEVLGTFTIYFDECRCPTEAELSWIETAAQLAAIAIVRERRDLEAHHQRKMKALETLAGGVTHDFNNLLTVISGNTHIALDELPAEHAARDHLADAVNATNRAAALLAQLSMFSRREDAKREPVAMGTIVDDAVKLLRAISSSKLRIDVLAYDESAFVMGDAAQLRQLVLNLGTNATQAIGDAPGTITIRIDVVVVEGGAPHRSTRSGDGRYVRLTMRDTGCGMDRATKSRMFDPFFTTRIPGRGTGLGLSVAHGIIENHGGASRVQSEPGKGTLFEIVFPGVERTSVRATPSRPPIESAKAGQHILFVDDDEALIYIASRQLERLGYRVSAFDDPIQAFEVFRTSPRQFDALVTDLGMVGMTGIDLSREALAIRADIPIIITSGYVRSEDVRAAAALGIHDVVLKPNSVQELARIVQAVLSHKTGDAPEIAR